jgi:hypothetical protein
VARRNEFTFALNAGGVDSDALSRIDQEKMRIAGQHPVKNLLPKVLGPSMLRPGIEYLSPISTKTIQLPFVRSVSKAYMLLFSDSEMRIGLDGAIVQVPAVSSAINTALWTDESVGSATATGGSTLTFNATLTEESKLRQAVTILAADQAIDNILRIAVDSGPVHLRIGTTAAGEEIQKETALGIGIHKIGFTPNAATIYIEFRTESDVVRTISQIDFESTLIGGAGDLVIPTPYDSSDIDYLRHWRSIDVMYIADGVSQQREIQHRGDSSWSIVLHEARDGPFVSANRDLVTLTPGALRGNTTLTASEAFFNANMVRSLLEVTHRSKTVEQTLTGAGQSTDYVTVIGVGSERKFSFTSTSSAFVGTLTLERSLELENPTTWTSYRTWVDAAAVFPKYDENDGDDNLTAHYRFTIKAGDYTSGSLDVELEYEGGVQIGLCRITAFNSTTSIDVEVLRSFGNIEATKYWRIGDWSDDRGWPRVPIIHDGRLTWFRGDEHYGSVSDDFTSYDDTVEGDSGPIIRSVGTEGAEGVVWAVSGSRLLVGTTGFEAVIQASEYDEALKPTAFTVRKPSFFGSKDIRAVPNDHGAVFVQRFGKRLYEVYLPQGSSRYQTRDLSRLNPEAYRSGVVIMADQRQPDTRFHSVLADGTDTVLTYEREDKVNAITTIETSGTIEDVAVLPGSNQDDVYYIVNRSGSRYWGKLADEEDQSDVSTCALLDVHKTLTGTIASISGSTYLASETVSIWSDGQ